MIEGTTTIVVGARGFAPGDFITVQGYKPTTYVVTRVDRDTYLTVVKARWHHYLWRWLRMKWSEARENWRRVWR